MSSAFTRALLEAWRREAGTRAAGRRKVALAVRTRALRTASSALYMWHAATQYRRQTRALGAAAEARRACRVRRRLLAAWRAAAARRAWPARQLCRQMAVGLRRALLAWRLVAAGLRRVAEECDRAERHLHRCLLTAALAHWRVLHLRRRIQGMWREVSTGRDIV